MQRIHWKVYGRVQGVGFRWFVAKRGRGLDLAGYARNCSDGTVQIEAEGSAASLERLRALVTTGPAGSRVETITEQPASATPLPRPFGIVR